MKGQYLQERNDWISIVNTVEQWMKAISRDHGVGVSLRMAS